MASHLADHLTFDDRNEHPQQPDLEKQTSVRPPSGEGSTRPYAATDTSNPPGTAQNSVRDRKKPVDQKSKLNPMGPFYVLGEPTTRRLLMFGNFEMILSAGFTIYIWCGYNIQFSSPSYTILGSTSDHSMITLVHNTFIMSFFSNQFQ